jgi:hypothetical protein
MTDEEKIAFVQKLLLDNQTDTLNADRHYKSAVTALQAKQGLRMERKELLHQLERLTGKPMPDVDDLAAPIPGKSDEGSGPEKEKVRT